MSREVTITILCDACTEEGTLAPGEVSTEEVLPGQTLDLCERHVGTFLTPLHDLLAVYGDRPGVPAASTQERSSGPSVDCPVCGFTSRSWQALGQHLKSHHDTTVGEVYGLACYLCTGTYANASGLSTHVSSRHGVSLYGSVAQARAAGVGKRSGTLSALDKRIDKLDRAYRAKQGEPS